MSGKKRSEVRAALDMAARAADTARAMRAESDARSLRSLGRAADSDLDRARGAGIPSIEPGLPEDEVRGARDATATASSALRDAEAAQQKAKKSQAEASAIDGKAAAKSREAQRALDEAQRSFDAKPGAHYMDHEWQLATAAGRLFKDAQDEAERAAQARARAINDAQAAVAAASGAAAAAQRAGATVKAAVSAAKERQRREAEARRIAEAARRKATVAVAAAGAAVAQVPDEDGRRFAPANVADLRSRLSEAEASLSRGDSAKAQQVAESVQSLAVDVARSVALARADYDRRRSEAEAALAGLASVIEGADRELVEQWSGQPSAHADAAKALAAGRAALAKDDFAAAQAATRAGQALRAAMAAAVAAKEADDRRNEIGAAILDALDEMHFDVSWDAGTRDQPLRLAGQTANESGRGDFTVAIPLSGEVDFEVTAIEGDTACVAAVQQLQAKLAERGIGWKTTDWGHALDAAKAGPGTVRTHTKTETHTRTRTR